LAGLCVGHTALIEAGRKPNIQSETAKGLAGVLGVSLDWLLAGDGAVPDGESIRRSVRKAERSPRVAGAR
jgi:hypothetical protein